MSRNFNLTRFVILITIGFLLGQAWSYFFYHLSVPFFLAIVGSGLGVIGVEEFIKFRKKSKRNKYFD